MWQWFILWWPLIYALRPRLLSHTTPLVLKRSPLSAAPKIKRHDPAQPGSARPNPARHNRLCILRFVWVSNEKQMDSEEKTRRREGGGKKGSLITYLRRKITQGRCLIITICLVWFLLGRPCGLPDCSMVHFSHYLILDRERKEESGLEAGGCCGSQWEGCGEVGGPALRCTMW